MTTDLTGGFDASLEYAFSERPAPGVRDVAVMYVLDDRGLFALPRFLVESVAPGEPEASAFFDGSEVQWETPLVQLNVAFADGRRFRVNELGCKHSTEASDGTHSVLGAGPLGFRCVEPFRLWTASFQGAAVQTPSSELFVGGSDGPSVDLEFHIEARMALPPWRQGTLSPQTEAYNHPEEKPYEQLFRATGALRLGDEEHVFNGFGLRVRRQGLRRARNSHNGGRGYCWQSALFPSGKAFGCDSNPPRPDGLPPFNDAYIFPGDGSLIPARVVEAPFLRMLQPSGEDVSLVLESELGTTRIEGETVASIFRFHPHGPGFAVHMGGVRYRWDGEDTYGMIERSAPHPR